MATFSHAYLNTLYYKVKNQPGKAFYSDLTVKLITDNCILVASRYTNGLVDYTMNQDIVTDILSSFMIKRIGDLVVEI